MHNSVLSTLDLKQDGYSHSEIKVPFSVDRSPYFQVTVPVYRWSNGEGPQLLIVAGNHGDEYEGPLVLFRLMRALGGAKINGGVTLIPSLNQPAAMAGKRCSPLDGGNMNRAFPGSATTPTQKIAQYLESSLIPEHDAVFDIHSGGTTMEHIYCALCEATNDKHLNSNQIAAMSAMGMRYGFVADNGLSSPTSMGAARRAGILGVSGEFGGGATTTSESRSVTATAIDGLLLHLGITKTRLISPVPSQTKQMERLDLSRQTQFAYAQESGWFEPHAILGEKVGKNQIAGYMHDPERPFLDPKPYTFDEDGIVISRRLPTPSLAGDCLFNIAAPA